MKNYIFTVLFLGIISHVFVSCKTTEKPVTHRYFTIRLDTFHSGGQVKYYTRTAIRKTNDSPGHIIDRHKRRFQYFVKHCVQDQNLKQYAPDSIRIKKLFEQTLDSKICRRNFQKLLYSRPKDTLAMEEVMKTASCFFYLSKQRDNKSVVVHICSGLNGYKDQNEPESLLLQSLLFEAIFEGLKQDSLPAYYKEVNAITPEIVHKYKRKMEDIDSLVYYARRDIFQSMQTSRNLEKYLREWFQKNKDNVPVIIR